MMSLPVWLTGLCLWSHVPSGKGGLSRGVSVQGVYAWGVSVRGASIRETPRMVMSGRYASYWNAFLIEECFVLRYYSMNVVNNLKNSVKQHNVIAGRNWQSLKINHPPTESIFCFINYFHSSA